MAETLLYSLCLYMTISEPKQHSVIIIILIYIKENTCNCPMDHSAIFQFYSYSFMAKLHKKPREKKPYHNELWTMSQGAT